VVFQQVVPLARKVNVAAGAVLKVEIGLYRFPWHGLIMPSFSYFRTRSKDQLDRTAPAIAYLPLPRSEYRK